MSFCLAVAVGAGGFVLAQAETVKKHHGLSLIGTPQLGPDFPYFPYVNPDAPKGGKVRMWGLGTFDTVNPIPLKGRKAMGLGLIYDELMTPSLDEASTEYGLIAEWASYPDDYSSVTFGLRPEARWHDGKPITPEDVIFSLQVLKENNPFYAFYYKNVVRAEKTGEREVTFHFDVKGNRELPQIMGQLTIFPKHYWDGQKDRVAGKTTLEPPVGSGPYRIKEVEAGRYIVYERVPDYWAKDLPVRKGYFNFDEIRYDYFRDQTIAFEAFKAGQLDFFAESSSKNWATGYNFPALKKGLVVKRDDIVLKTPQPMQAFVLNTRRKMFADPRVRRAFNLAFDFEWTNKNLFYGQYKRTGSFFENTELAARGVPQGRELEILKELRAEYPDYVPDEALTKPYENPKNPTPRDIRKHLREAVKLLREAGWTIKNGVLTSNKTGERMEVEFLLVSPLFERIVLPYIRNLERLGIKARVRLVDTPQYKERTDRFDFDIIVDTFPQSESPGNEQRDFWGSEAASKQGSRNTIGIRNPAVDKLVDMIIFARDRAELVAATRALDRVLLWNNYVVPQWYVPFERIAYWNRFDHPKRLPSRSVGFLQVWWYDAERAARLNASR